jgi:hypothetical protein
VATRVRGQPARAPRRQSHLPRSGSAHSAVIRSRRVPPGGIVDA